MYHRLLPRLPVLTRLALLPVRQTRPLVHHVKISRLPLTLSGEATIHFLMDRAPGGLASVITSYHGSTFPGPRNPAPGSGVRVRKSSAGTSPVNHRWVPLLICNPAYRGRMLMGMSHLWKRSCPRAMC